MNDSLFFGEDEAVGDLVDMDTAAEGDDEGSIFDDTEIPVEDDDNNDDDDGELKLDGYHDLGIVEGDDEDAMDEDDDADFDEAVAAQSRKLVKPTTPTGSAARMQFESADASFHDEDNTVLTKPSSRVPGTFGRRNRQKGDTLPAYHKRVTHELDSDDELMMEMRDKGYSDRQIADRLAKDGRIRYDQKSISTRIMRIRLAQAENVDFLLKEGYKEWEFHDDELLMQAYALADIEINYEVERIRAWRYRKVSEYMRRLDKDAIFSATACRERFMGIVDGTARIPTDMDDDPGARRFELENYRQSRELARTMEQEEKEAKAANARQAKEDAIARNAEKAEAIAKKRDEIERGKADRAMNRALAAQMRSQRASQNSISKTQRNTTIQKQRTAKNGGIKKIPFKSKGKGKSTTTTKPALSPMKALELTNAEINATTTDPRSFLDKSDLIKLCDEQNLPSLGKTKTELLQELKGADDEHNKSTLEKMCKAKGLNSSGTKLAMKYHLALAAAKSCESLRAGVEAMAKAEKDTAMELAE